MYLPLVSIIIPTYNRSQLICETLDSVLAQTYENWECIIVDDGSTDDTKTVVGEYVKKDSRFQFHKRPLERLKGGNAARNFGFELSKGTYINWLDSDDLFSENKIELQVLLLTKNNADVSTTKWGRFKNKDNYKLKELSIYSDYDTGLDLLEQYGKSKIFFPSHTFMVKRSLILKAGQWNENLTINQDGEFFCRVLILSNKIVFVSTAHVAYRIANESNISILNTRTKANHILYSTKLIEIYLSITGNEKKCEEYINSNKSYCYKLLYKDFKDLINNDKIFFKNQISEFRILKKIRYKILKFLK